MDFRRLIMADRNSTDILSRLRSGVQHGPIMTGAKILGQLLGVASTFQQQEAGQPQREEVKRVGSEAKKALLNPLQENVLKAVQKVHKKQVEEAMNAGGSGEQVLKDAGISIATEQPTNEEGKPDGTSLALAGAQPPELDSAQQQKKPGSNIADILGNILSLGGFIQPSAQDQLALAQADKLRKDPGAFGEFQLDVLKEQFKQDRLDNRERIKADLAGDDNAKSIELAVSTANSLVDIRSKIMLTGPGRGQLGALLGSVGIGTGLRAEFESTANQFVFDVGALLGQKGRAFTEKEQKLVREKVIQASLSAKQSDFVGRMKAVAKRINTTAGEEVFTVDNKGRMSRGVKQNQPGTKSVVDAEYDRYLSIVGGK